jgi:hypothetical protein
MGLILSSIPYKSQYDPDASEFRNDCGPASLAMILHAFGINVSTNSVYRKTGTEANRYVSVSQLMRAGLSYGVPFDYFYNWSIEKLKEGLLAGHTMIVLVHYAGWSKINPGVSTQNTFEGPHFVTVVGFDDEHIFVNDPLWKEERRGEGYRKAWTYKEFFAAWDSNHEDGNRDRSGIITQRTLPTKAYSKEDWPTPGRAEINPRELQRMQAWAYAFGVPNPDITSPASVNAYMAAMGKWGQRIASHKVSANDDLGILAHKYYGDPMKWDVILAFNGLAQSDTIHDGDLLRIPEPLEQPISLPMEQIPSGGTFRHSEIQKITNLTS